MNTARIPISDIEVGHRHRGCDGDKVTALMESIQELGLRTPLSVARRESTFRLVTGMHRLEACRRLGWDSVDVVFVDGLDEIGQQLWEIDENLVRAELTEGERSEHLLRRKELFELRRQQERQAGVVSGARPQHERGFASDTAERTGLTKRHINRSIRRAEHIAHDVRDSIRLTPAFRKAVELDALAELDHDDQRCAVSMVATDEARSFRDAKDRLTAKKAQPTSQRQLRALQNAWKGASEEARTTFLRGLEADRDTTRSGQ